MSRISGFPELCAETVEKTVQLISVAEQRTAQNFLNSILIPPKNIDNHIFFRNLKC
jgi:hypothetical protein